MVAAIAKLLIGLERQYEGSTRSQLHAGRPKPAQASKSAAGALTTPAPLVCEEPPTTLPRGMSPWRPWQTVTCKFQSWLPKGVL